MQTTIIDHQQETPSVTTFKFEKPPGFTHQVGQFINIELQVENCDVRCNKRNFSLVSTPLDDHLMIATRHGVSRFKQTLESFKKDDTFNFSGPLGRFVLNEEPIPAVMLSGGIGITPLHAMIKYAAAKKLTKPITLIYSNTKADDIPFKKDLDEYHTSDMAFGVHYTVTSEAPPKWPGKVGRIDENMIRELVPNWKECEFYVCGPAQMVIALKKMLLDMGVTVEKLKSELFTGY